ncbi:C-x8-C-x5-C-x3-H type zinc finger protein [Metarhizium guizhouense ARSEF 977]|uniref:C-x8-C-x5-C-x3-H type zinc finger protein n=1 Tax=Metarhizium guizhouense (strain ARSEF 977) TaxID=1276136 RepID=A0A0B4GU02_METGA|nr:C-x8-C-x5-C-x3-H type zinc finger protein [Metarhizium guizhouense ARSEF 977]
MVNELGEHGTRLALLRGQFDQGLAWIEERLQKLEDTEAKLKQAELDLEHERTARRRLQQANDLWEERQARRPFAVALIDADADGYMFPGRFIAKGEKGGEEAADMLLTELQDHLRVATAAPNGIDILVKAFANVGGLVTALKRRGTIQDENQLRAFLAGFNSRKAFFDFVDVGSGKERADCKVRQNFEYFLRNFQCQHLVVTCGHDAGYAPFLGQFVGDKEVVDRVTLLRGNPFLTVISDLGFKSTRFDSVFGETTRTPVSTDARAPVWGGGIAPIGPLISPMGPAPNAGVPRKVRTPPNRLGPVLKDENGSRVDKELTVDRKIVERLKKGHLCFYFYLRGRCNPLCQQNHLHRPLTENEFDALWWIARQSNCTKGITCSDPSCVYGHMF